LTWPVAGLALVAESARLGLRELDRLAATAEKGRAVLAGTDRPSRLADTIDALLRELQGRGRQGGDGMGGSRCERAVPAQSQSNTSRT
jgi:hypothetical protein